MKYLALALALTACASATQATEAGKDRARLQGPKSEQGMCSREPGSTEMEPCPIIYLRKATPEEAARMRDKEDRK